MRHDHNGQLHAGTIGLFDDPDEVDAAEARIIHQQAITETRARKLDAKAQRKEEEEEEERKVKQYTRPYLIQRVISLFGSTKKMKDHEREKLMSGEVSGGKGDEVKVRDENLKTGSKGGDEKERRGGEAQDKMYEDWEVDTGLDSPFYEELDMVRIKAGNGRDVKVVHKSRIRSSGPLADYGEGS